MKMTKVLKSVVSAVIVGGIRSRLFNTRNIVKSGMLIYVVGAVAWVRVGGFN